MQDKFENKIKSQLENYEISPPPMAWENISSALEKEQPKSKAWIAWMRIAAIFLVPALVALGIFVLRDPKNNNSPKQDLHITHSPSDTSTIENSMDDKNKVNATTSRNDMEMNTSTHNSSNASVARYSEPSTTDKVNHFFANLFGENDTRSIPDDTTQPIATSGESKGIFSTISDFFKGDKDDIRPSFSSPELYAYYEEPRASQLQITAFNAEEIKPKKEKASKKSKFLQNLSLRPYAGVSMLSSFNQPSLIAPAFNALEVDNKIATTFGANATYQISDRLKMRSGVGVLDLTQDTYNVPLKYTASENSIVNNVKSYTNVNVDLAESGYTSDFSENLANASVGGIEQDLSHQVQFIEVPVEVEYAIAQGNKLSVAATGGMSTLFLNKNEVYLKDINTVLAKSTNIKSVSFSANAGVRLDYEVTEKLSINVEPQLKYMINTVTANDDIQPYLLGVNAGISYSL